MRSPRSNATRPCVRTRVDHRRVRFESYRFGTRECLFCEVFGFGQQTFDARNPGERAGQCDLLEAWCAERIQRPLAYLACAIEIAEPQPGARGQDGPVLGDLVVGEVLRYAIIGQRPFDLVGFSVLHPHETSRDHESGAVGIIEVVGAVVRADDPRRRLAGRCTCGQRERKVGEATGFAGCGLRSYLGREAMQHATVALDVGVDEAVSEQLECFCFLTCQQEVTKRILDVTRSDGESSGASMESLFAVRIVGVESVPQQITEEMVVPSRYSRPTR